MNVLYHSIIMVVGTAMAILWGLLGILGLLVIALFTVGMLEDEYRPTLIASIIAAMCVGAYFSDNNEVLSTTPVQICEYHLKLVDTTSSRIEYSQTGMLFRHYDTIPDIKNASIDTIKTNCYDVK